MTLLRGPEVAQSSPRALEYAAAARALDLDDFTALASLICDLPISVISLGENLRQSFQACHGLEPGDTLSTLAFDRYAFHATELMEVPDAQLDVRFAGTSVLTDELPIRFYAAAPLVSAEGHIIGTLCVVDRRPRLLTTGQRKALVRLARQVMALLEAQRSASAEHALTRIHTGTEAGTSKGIEIAALQPASDAEDNHEASEQQLQAIFEFAPMAIIMLKDDGGIVQLNRKAEALFGYEREELEGQPIEVLVGESDRARYMHLIDHFFLAPKASAVTAERGKLTGVRRDGTSFPIDISLGPVESTEGVLAAAVVRDISLGANADAKIRSALHEKETLLKEIHHRVKNNLQIISSLLSMQADASNDTQLQVLLQDSIHRVRSMALIHERLYQSATLASIDFGDYARSLTTFLVRSYKMSTGVDLIMDTEPTELNIETAIPLGLVLNEVVCNALKHAFCDGKPGQLRVSLRHCAGGLSLTVSDTGQGFPADFDLESASSMGLTLIKSLARQINAELTIESDKGANIRVFFKELSYATL